jgi:hypothetical protein
MFQINFVKNIKTHILYSITFFWKSCRLWDNVEKYVGAREAADDNILDKWRYSRASTRPRLCTHPHTRTQALTRVPSPPRALSLSLPLSLSLTHTHTHKQKHVTRTAFIPQERFRERATMLRYPYTASLVLKSGHYYVFCLTPSSVPLYSNIRPFVGWNNVSLLKWTTVDTYTCLSHVVRWGLL